MQLQHWLIRDAGHRAATPARDDGWIAASGARRVALAR